MLWLALLAPLAMMQIWPGAKSERATEALLHGHQTKQWKESDEQEGGKGTEDCLCSLKILKYFEVHWKFGWFPSRTCSWTCVVCAIGGHKKPRG